jgi:prephenate dehydratase
MQIAYLGPAGTYSEEALRGICQPIPFLQEARFVAKATIADCLLDCSLGAVDYALVPVENSIEGSVNVTLDWLIHQVDIPIQGEIALMISHHALVHPSRKDEPLSEVETVLSHPQAIAQCHHFIRSHCPNAQVSTMRSTAEAAEYVANHPEEKLLAIGPHAAGEKYGLHTVLSHIEDHSNNYTRFLLIGHQPVTDFLVETDKWLRSGKTSILVTLPEDFPGALHQVLSAFAWRKLNLTRIESRPTKKKLGSYFFIIDIGQEMDDTLVPGAISEIEALGCQVRLLGSYPCFMPHYSKSEPVLTPKA